MSSSLFRWQTTLKIISLRFCLQLWSLFHSHARSGRLQFVEQSSLALSLLSSDRGFRVFLSFKPHKYMIKTEDLGKT